MSPQLPPAIEADLAVNREKIIQLEQRSNDHEHRLRILDSLPIELAQLREELQKFTKHWYWKIGALIVLARVFPEAWVDKLISYFLK